MFMAAERSTSNGKRKVRPEGTVNKGARGKTADLEGAERKGEKEMKMVRKNRKHSLWLSEWGMQKKVTRSSPSAAPTCFISPLSAWYTIGTHFPFSLLPACVTALCDIMSADKISTSTTLKYWKWLIPTTCLLECVSPQGHTLHVCDLVNPPAQLLWE